MNDLRSGPENAADIVEIGDLSGSIGFLLRLAQLQVFEQFFEALSKYDLKPGEFSVLWVVSLNPGLRQGAIARRLRIKPAHMTKVIQRLETAGFLSRTIPEDDRRSVQLSLTEVGIDFVSRHKPDFFSYFQRDPERLSEAELTTLITLLQKFVGIAKVGS